MHLVGGIAQSHFGQGIDVIVGNMPQQHLEPGCESCGGRVSHQGQALTSHRSLEQFGIEARKIPRTLFLVLLQMRQRRGGSSKKVPLGEGCRFGSFMDSLGETGEGSLKERISGIDYGSMMFVRMNRSDC